MAFPHFRGSGSVSPSLMKYVALTATSLYAPLILFFTPVLQSPSWIHLPSYILGAGIALFFILFMSVADPITSNSTTEE